MSAKRKSRSQHSGGIGRCTTLPAISMVVEPSACAISFGATRADSLPSCRIVSCGSIWAWMSMVRLRSIVGTIPALHDVISHVSRAGSASICTGREHRRAHVLALYGLSEWTGRAGSVGCLELDQEHRAGFSADLPERWPRPPSTSGVESSCPQWMSPDPFRPRTICVSMNQRPDNGTTTAASDSHATHRPTGGGQNRIAATSSGLSQPQGRRLPPTLFISNPPSAQVARLLVPFGPVHRL